MSERNKIRYTKEFKYLIYRALLDGVSKYQIHKDHDISLGTLSVWVKTDEFKSFEIAYHAQKPRCEQVAEIVEGNYSKENSKSKITSEYEYYSKLLKRNSEVTTSIRKTINKINEIVNTSVQADEIMLLSKSIESLSKSLTEVTKSAMAIYHIRPENKYQIDDKSDDCIEIE